MLVPSEAALQSRFFRGCGSPRGGPPLAPDGQPVFRGDRKIGGMRLGLGTGR